MKKYVAAIDLGTTHTVVAIGEKSIQGVKIVALSEVPSKGMKRGRIENPQLASQSIKSAIEMIRENYHLNIEKAFIGIAGQDIKCISTEPCQVQRADAEEIITFEEVSNITKSMYRDFDDGTTVLCAIPQSYNVDTNMSVSQAVGMIGKNIVSRFKLVIGKKAFNTITNSTMKLANIKCAGFIIEPIASAMAVLTDEEKEAGVVLVDIGGGTTDVIVIQNHIIRYIGIIPFGGDSITKDICMGCNISNKQSESLKINYGNSFSDYADPNKMLYVKPYSGTTADKEIPVKTLSKIIQARMEEILDAVNYHVEQSGFAKQILAGYVFTGGGSQIKSLINLTNYMTGKDARCVAPNENTILESSVEEARRFNSSTVVGMIIKGIEMIEEENGSYDFVSEYYPTKEVEQVHVEENVLPWETVTVDDTEATTSKRAERKKRGEKRDSSIKKLSGFIKGFSLFGDSFDNPENTKI